jgi:hypothetical protein
MANHGLCGGGVKARRPRVSAVEAKRRALHADEHSASIEFVMAGAADVSTFVVTVHHFSLSRNASRAWTKSSGHSRSTMRPERFVVHDQDLADIVGPIVQEISDTPRAHPNRHGALPARHTALEPTWGE